MNFSEETIQWGRSKLAVFSSLHGYPKEDMQITLQAKALLRIAHPVAVLTRWNHKAVTDHMLSAPPEALEAVTIQTDKLGIIHPMEWLLEKALDKFQFMPAPVQLRIIFAQYFPCADGVDPETSVED